MPMSYKLPGEEDEPEAEEPAAEAPADLFAGTGVDLSDPNKPLSADDIAALFAQANEASEPEAAEEEEEEFMPTTYKLPGEEDEPEELPEPIAFEEPVVEEPVAEEPEEPVAFELPVEEKKPEDAFASSGVDLSDPNKPLSADDIAALFASMGN